MDTARWNLDVNGRGDEESRRRQGDAWDVAFVQLPTAQRGERNRGHVADKAPRQRQKAVEQMHRERNHAASPSYELRVYHTGRVRRQQRKGHCDKRNRKKGGAEYTSRVQTPTEPGKRKAED